MTRTTSQLDLFDNRQADLFAAPAPAPIDDRAAQRAALAEEQAIAEAEAEAERARPGYADDDENERGEWRDEHERRHKQAMAAAGRAEASGIIERLTWGEGTKTKAPSHHMHWGKPGFVVELFEESGQWFSRTAWQLKNGSSSGPFRSEAESTRDAVLIHIMRAKLRSLAHVVACDNENRKSAQAMADAIFELVPPLLYGIDLAAEFAEELTAQRDECARRGAVLRKVDVIERAAQARLIELEAWGYPDLIQDRSRTAPGDAEAYTDSFVANYAVRGGPDTFELVIYEKSHRNPARTFLEPIRAALETACKCPARFATVEELEQPSGLRRDLHW